MYFNIYHNESNWIEMDLFLHQSKFSEQPSTRCIHQPETTAHTEIVKEQTHNATTLSLQQLEAAETYRFVSEFVEEAPKVSS